MAHLYLLPCIKKKHSSLKVLDPMYVFFFMVALLTAVICTIKAPLVSVGHLEALSKSAFGHHALW